MYVLPIGIIKNSNNARSPNFVRIGAEEHTHTPKQEKHQKKLK